MLGFRSAQHMLAFLMQESLREPLALSSFAVTRMWGRTSSPGVVRTAAKPRLCLLDTHFFPLSNLLWHKGIIHWYVRIPVRNINLPYACMWWQLPRSPGRSSLSFPLMLSTQRKILACLPSPQAILPLRGGGSEKDGGGKKITLGGLWPWDPELGALAATWPRNTQVSSLPMRPALFSIVLPSSWGLGGGGGEAHLERHWSWSWPLGGGAWLLMN